jgi:hypothetical protein
MDLATGTISLKTSSRTNQPHSAKNIISATFTGLEKTSKSLSKVFSLNELRTTVNSIRD